MKRIVINRCFGGFSLSLKAELRYAELKGFKLFFYKQTKYSHQTPEKVNEWIRVESDEDCLFVNSLKVDLGAVTNTLNYKDGEYFNSRDIERDDLDLIQIIEGMGTKASGQCAELKIVEIPDDVDWEIDDYDGLEKINEKHRSWS